MPHFYSLSTVIGAVAGVKLFQNAPNKQDRVVNYIKAFKGKHFNTDRLQHQMSLQVCIADFRSTEKMKDDEDHALKKLISSIEDAECLDELHTSWIQHEKIMADAIDHSSKSEVLILTTINTAHGHAHSHSPIRTVGSAKLVPIGNVKPNPLDIEKKGKKLSPSLLRKFASSHECYRHTEPHIAPAHANVQSVISPNGGIYHP
eukprot:55445_1